MAVFTVLYPARDGAKFDLDYYEAAHIPLAKAAFADTGLESVQVLKWGGDPGGGPAPYVAIALLTFRDTEALTASLGGPRAAEVMGDVANFTDIQPVAQVSEAR